MSRRHQPRRGNFGNLGDPYAFGHLGTRPPLANEAPPGFTQLTHDFTQMDRLPSQITFSRSSLAWDYQLRQYASGAPRLVAGEGLLIEGQRQNKCENFNVGQSGTQGMTPFGGALVQVVPVASAPIDVQDALAAQNIDLGTVQSLLEMSGDAASGVDIGGATGNTNAHTLSVFAFISAGSGNLRFSGGGGSVPLSSGFVRTVSANATPAAGTERLTIENTAAGSRIWFFANQLEEGAFATSPIVTSGAAQIRSAETASEAFTRSGTVTIEAEFDAGDFTRFVVVSDFHRVFNINDGTASNIISAYSTGGGAATMRYNIAAGGATRLLANGTAAINGRTTVRVIAAAGNYSALINGAPDASSADAGAPPATTTIGYGYDYPNNAQYLDGYLRSFALWDRLI